MAIVLELLAVLEVDPADRIRCQAPGCRHTVYRRIHVIRTPEGITVLGSTCFRTMYAGTPLRRAAPRYTDTSGRRLSAAEALQLATNTTMLLEALEAEHNTQQAARTVLARPFAASFARNAPKAAPVPTEALEDARREATRRVQARHPDLADELHLPGWAGLVLCELREVLKERGLT